jgi:hypothetical protein
MTINTLVIIFLCATAGGTLGYGLWRDMRSRRRLASRLCVRCGKPTVNPVDLTRTEVGAHVPLIMCPECAVRTRQNHRLAYWLYLIFCGLGLGAVALGMSGDLRRGVHYSFWDYLWLPGVILIPALALLPVFRRGLDRDDV